MKKRCFVTGGTGHLGIALVHELIQSGHQVAVLVRPSSPLEGLSDVLDRLTLIQGDLTRVAEFEPALRNFQPEAVFHLAWFGVANRFKNDPRQITENLYGSLNLLEASARSGCQVWLGLGSQAEYGRVDGILTEDLPLRPETTYGVVKQAVGALTERLCEALQMRHVWVRLLATYGPHDDPLHLLPFVIEKYRAGEVPALTLGEQVWDYLYVQDAARALVALLEHEAAGVFNLASGEGRSVRQMVEYLRDSINPALESGLGHTPYPVGQIMHLQGDIGKLTRATGWTPTTTFEEGIQQTLAWHARKAP